MSQLLLLFAVFCLNNGFLLNNNPFQNNTVGVTEHYLTIEDRRKLQEDIEKQHQDLVALRKEQNQALNILTSQLQQTLVELDKRFQSVSNQNSTCEQVFLVNTQLKREMQEVKTKTRLLEYELSSTKNRTLELENELRDVKHSQEQTVIITERDMQISCNQSISQHVALLEKSFTSNITLLRQDMQASNNKTWHEFVATQEAMEQFNRTTHRQIVAVTALGAESKACASGEIVRFTHFITSIGVPNQTKFVSTGKFETSYTGLYLIALTMMSDTNDADFRVYKNDQLLNYLRIGIAQSVNFNYREVSGNFVLHLQTGDMVYVKCQHQQDVFRWSMIAITKLD